MKYIRFTKTELESYRFKIMNKINDKTVLDSKNNIISFLIDNVKYKINISDILSNLILYQNLNIYLRMMKEKLDYTSYRVVDFFLLESKIYRVENYFNQIFRSVKKEVREVDYKKNHENLRKILNLIYHFLVYIIRIIKDYMKLIL